jgi:dihydroorotase
MKPLRFSINELHDRPLANEYLLTNMVLVDPSQALNAPCSLWVADGKIKAVVTKNEAPPTEILTIDCNGALVTPGLVDLHVHLREPGFEYKETIQTGTQAAAAGGFTSVLCMANTNPVNDNPYVTQFIISQARSYGVVKVYPVGALSKELKGEQLAEIGKMRDAGIVAVSDDGMTVMNSYLMRKALDYCKAFGLPIISHAEDTYLVGQGVMHEGVHSNCLGLRGIPAESEEIIVARDVALARLTQGRVHFAHLSTWQALEHVRRAKAEGLSVTAEVSPHHLTFTDESVSQYDSSFKMAPPLRTAEDIEALVNALRDGTLDCIATDHAPHAPRDKAGLFENAMNGVVGLETAWSVGVRLVNAGKLTIDRLVETMSCAPAKIASIDGGTLRVGACADIAVFDMKKSYKLSSKDLHSKSKNSPFLGVSLQAQVRATFVNGELRWIRTEDNE